MDCPNILNKGWQRERLPAPTPRPLLLCFSFTVCDMLALTSAGEQPRRVPFSKPHVWHHADLHPAASGYLSNHNEPLDSPSWHWVCLVLVNFQLKGVTENNKTHFLGPRTQSKTTNNMGLWRRKITTSDDTATSAAYLTLRASGPEPARCVTRHTSGAGSSPPIC